MINRDLFDVPADVTYLNCANMAPRLRAVTNAGHDAIASMATPWRIRAEDWFSGAERRTCTTTSPISIGSSR